MKSSQNNFLYITALIVIILGACALYTVRSISTAGNFSWSNLIAFIATTTVLTGVYYVLKLYQQRIWHVSKYVIFTAMVCMCIVLFVITADTIVLFALVNIFIVLFAFATKQWIKFPKGIAYTLVFCSCFIFFTLHVWNIIGSRQLDTVFGKIKEYGYITSTQQVNELYLKTIDSKKNGGSIIVAVSSIIQSRLGDFETKMMNEMIPHEQTNENQLFFTNEDLINALQEVLSNLHRELRILDHALSYPQLIIPLQFPDKVYAMPLPHLSSLSSVNKMLNYKFLYEIHKKQRKEALSTLKQNFKICDMFDFEPILISQLVKYAMEKRTLVAIGDAISYENDPETLQQLIEIVETRCKYKPSNFEVELLYLCNIFSEVENTVALKATLDTDLQRELGIPFINLIPRGFLKQDVAYGLQCIIQSISLNKKGEKAVRNSFYQKEKMNNWYPISSMTVPYFSVINKKDFQRLAIARCVFSALHLRLQQLQSQQVDFAQIKKKYPLYTTDPYTGKSLLNTSTKEGYIIYSIGEDLKNDGGIITQRADTGVLLRKEK